MGLQACRRNNWDDVMLVSDCLDWANAIRKRSVFCWSLTHLCFSIFQLLNFSDLDVVWVPRECNKSAHTLASWAFRLNLSGTFSLWEVTPTVATMHAFIL
ncbi:Ribonuclease H-like domain containing protein [Trema orientale]|uniref:Ribonuclease H-like domain containing protein n=1 Tax=Trema orientale TaxID=63057 RepID=A0A2P5E7V2_TREOI|nr:Ribonuclease H-like domain containing protein [Trema orientale]